MTAHLVLKKNDRFILNISAWGDKGVGVGYHQGFPINVPFTLPGDTIEVHLTKVLHTKAYGFCVQRLKDAPERALPACPVFSKCGGCQLQHATYAAQLDYKVDALKEKLSPFTTQVTRLKGPALAYRNKAQYSIQHTENGLAIGLSAPRSQRIIPIDTCAIQTPLCNTILTQIRTAILQHNIPIYTPKTQTAGLCGVIIRVGITTQEGLICLTTATPEDHVHLAPVIQTLLTNPHIKSIYHSVTPNPEWENLGTPPTLLAGQPHITEKIEGLTLTIGADDFFQANTAMIPTLWHTVAQHIPPHTQTLLDLYCGSGGMSLFLRHHVQHVIGIETHPTAIAHAQENAEKNGISTCQFIQADAQDLRAYPADVIVVDPPRKGLSKAVIAALTSHPSSTLIYISCNPDTLTENIKQLCHTGPYTLTHAIALDSFAQTSHLETVAILQK